VYEALAVLSSHPKFHNRVSKARGINVIVYEIDVRRKQRSSRRKANYDADEDPYTDALFAVLKSEWAATKIQAHYRRHRIRGKEHTLRRLSLSFDVMNPRVMGTYNKDEI